MASILELTAKYLQEKGFKVWVPQISETLSDLSSVFSHKMAATMSGLGWVGKNSIFISSKFGCGSRLATIFTDMAVTCGEPITKSMCGSCDKCVKVCPCNAIKGVGWYAGIPREELLAPWICKRYRDSFKEKFGFSHPCCLCIKACPFANIRE
jgi:epoxyqueuosine reductase QueG